MSPRSGARLPAPWAIPAAALTAPQDEDSDWTIVTCPRSRSVRSRALRSLAIGIPKTFDWRLQKMRMISHSEGRDGMRRVDATHIHIDAALRFKAARRSGDAPASESPRTRLRQASGAIGGDGARTGLCPTRRWRYSRIIKTISTIDASRTELTVEDQSRCDGLGCHRHVRMNALA